jgi:hypothetical protein
VGQFYVRDLLSEWVTRPANPLKGFQQITLQPDETHRVTAPSPD